MMSYESGRKILRALVQCLRNFHRGQQPRRNQFTGHNACGSEQGIRVAAMYSHGFAIGLRHTSAHAA